MTNTVAAIEWQANFPNVAPLGFLCRAAFPDQWLRIHSLPEAKRYAETESERREILHRHNFIANHVLGNESECILFFAQFGHDRCWDNDSFIPINAGRPTYSLTYEKDGDTWQFFSTTVVWRHQNFDDLILARADELTGPILFMNTTQGTAYAPYDGGADLFFSNQISVEGASAKFSSWLSSRCDGL